MPRPKTKKIIIADELAGIAGELSDDRVTAKRRKELASAILTESNKVRRLRKVA